MTALVSSVVGNTAAAAATKGKSADRITPEDFQHALERRNFAEVHDGVEAVTTWCEDHGGWISYGSRPASVPPAT